MIFYSHYLSELLAEKIIVIFWSRRNMRFMKINHDFFMSKHYDICLYQCVVNRCRVMQFRGCVNSPRAVAALKALTAGGATLYISVNSTDSTPYSLRVGNSPGLNHSLQQLTGSNISLRTWMCMIYILLQIMIKRRLLRICFYVHVITQIRIYIF